MITWNEDKLRKLFQRCDDVQIHVSSQQNLLLIFCEGLCSNVMLKELVFHGEEGGEHKSEHHQSKDLMADGLLLQSFPQAPSEQDIKIRCLKGILWYLNQIKDLSIMWKPPTARNEVLKDQQRS